MAKDYEIEVDIAISRIADALLSNPSFLSRLEKKLRQDGAKWARNVPGTNGTPPRNTNTSPINPPS